MFRNVDDSLTCKWQWYDSGSDLQVALIPQNVCPQFTALCTFDEHFIIHMWNICVIVEQILSLFCCEVKKKCIKLLK